MHNLADLMKVPKSGDESISAAFLQALADNSTRGNLPPNAFADATGVYQRPVLEVPEGIAFMAVGDVPGYTVIIADGLYNLSSNSLVLAHVPYSDSISRRLGNCLINGSADVANGSIGYATRGVHAPQWITLGAQNWAIYSGTTVPWGPGANGRMYACLPGFLLLGIGNPDQFGNYRGLFIRSSTAEDFTTKAIADWVRRKQQLVFGEGMVEVVPVDTVGNSYDGHNADFPNEQTEVLLRCASNTMPAVYKNDQIVCRTSLGVLASSSDAILVNAQDVGDDPIGSVKLWSGVFGIPQGWRIYDALNGRFPVGQLPGDADFGSLLTCGGEKNHMHNLSGLVASAGAGVATTVPTTTDLASRLPPYCVVQFIERYK